MDSNIAHPADAMHEQMGGIPLTGMWLFGGFPHSDNPVYQAESKLLGAFGAK
jgi:hypothetical protein